MKKREDVRKDRREEDRRRMTDSTSLLNAYYAPCTRSGSTQIKVKGDLPTVSSLWWEDKGVIINLLRAEEAGRSSQKLTFEMSLEEGVHKGRKKASHGVAQCTGRKGGRVHDAHEQGSSAWLEQKEAWLNRCRFRS